MRALSVFFLLLCHYPIPAVACRSADFGLEYRYLDADVVVYARALESKKLDEKVDRNLGILSRELVKLEVIEAFKSSHDQLKKGDYIYVLQWTGSVSSCSRVLVAAGHDIFLFGDRVSYRTFETDLFKGPFSGDSLIQLRELKAQYNQ